MPDAANYRAWRQAHPEYRDRERRRKRERRNQMTPEERRKDRGQKHRSVHDRSAAVLPSLHLGHELFDQAKELARCTDGFKYLAHPFYDDLISEIVLALLEGCCPEQAQKAFLKTERGWLHHTAPLLTDIL